MNIPRGDGKQNPDVFMEKGEVPSVTNLGCWSTEPPALPQRFPALEQHKENHSAFRKKKKRWEKREIKFLKVPESGLRYQLLHHFHEPPADSSCMDGLGSARV